MVDTINSMSSEKRWTKVNRRSDLFTRSAGLEGIRSRSFEA